jgi:4a-hydroxytetrahydrobiopterin dehydratase
MPYPPAHERPGGSTRPTASRTGLDRWSTRAAETRVAAAIAAGGRLRSDEHAPEWWTLADAEGNEVDVATVLGRG